MPIPPRSRSTAGSRGPSSAVRARRAGRLLVVPRAGRPAPGRPRGRPGALAVGATSRGALIGWRLPPAGVAAPARPEYVAVSRVFRSSWGQDGRPPSGVKERTCEVSCVSVPHPDLLLNERYRLDQRVASGGMADVWSARDEVLQRQVAVKVMRPDPDHEELFALRFRDEALNSAGADPRQHRHAVRLRRGRRPGLPGHGARRRQAPLAADPREGSDAGPNRCAPSSASAPWPWASPTSPRSCTATSSPPTSWCARTAW